MLKLQQVKKYYAGQKAVDDVSFDVRQGSIFGLLGPNGAGKSSILRMITGITQPDSGEIYIENQKKYKILFEYINHVPKLIMADANLTDQTISSFCVIELN
jgi:ABC-2 type transport system ATP-binding protein